MSLEISNQEKVGRNVSLKGLPTKEDLHVHGVTGSVDDVLTARLKNRQSQPTAALKPGIHLAWGGTTGQVAENSIGLRLWGGAVALGSRSGFGVAQRLWGGAALQALR
jgi:hypothetical protein